MSEKNSQGRLCMGCMNPLPEGRNECGICGYPANGNNEELYLKVGTVLSDRYLVGKMLEHTGDAAVYIGYDRVLKGTILIREFLPDTLVERKESGELLAITGCENAFREYYEKFRAHARALARMRDLPSIVPVYDIFEQNHTAYTISEYHEGNTLEQRLRQIGGYMKWDEARPLFMPLLSTLISLHTAGVLHLGITPRNIIIGNDGKLLLKGFSISEARRVNTDLRPHLVSGYTAPEQYSFGQEVGEWTDVYGLAATLFRTLTGNPPPDGSKRAKDSNDLLVPSEIAKELPDYVAAALFNALQVNPELRTRSIEKFRDELSTAPAVSKLREDDELEPAQEETEEEQETENKSGYTKYAVLIVAIIFIILLLIGGITVLLLFRDEIFGGGESLEPSTTSSLEESTTTRPKSTTTQPASAKYATPDLVGKNLFEIREETLIGEMKVEVEYKVYSNKAKGTIISQNPSPETPAEKGATIKVVISDGPELITVPNLSGWNYQHAELYLKALGFRVNITRVYSDTYDIDIVESVEQEGKELPEGSLVNIRVSETPKTTAEPDTNWWD
ncbi:MAG TPA: PASTA domain-containing protein [Candidatus Avimonas sp.]|nr:PASTA domain-containing protein [Candidatus Avimonas sp.]